MLHILSETPVAGSAGPGQGLAWDGCRFNLLSDAGRAVDQLDERFPAARSVSTARAYTCLAYDAEKRCYWAASGQRPSTLFQLDSEFKETSQVRLKTCGQITITSLSVQRCTGRLWIGHPSGVVLADRTGTVAHEPRGSACWIRGASPCAPMRWSGGA